MLSASLTHGQTTLPNNGFENWQNVGSNTEEPTNWNGNKTGGGFANLGPQTCFRESTNPHTGTYCLKLENASFFGTPVNATATTGKIEAPSTSPADGYIHTITADPNFSSTFTARPDSLVGWFKFDQSGSDVGRIQAVLHGNFDVSNPDQGGSAAHIIADATFDLPTGNTTAWTRFSVPFNYSNGAVPTHVLLIATASSTVGSASIGTTLWIDDLDVVYCTPPTDTLTEVACDSYTSPSGNHTWMSSGTYQDTIVGAAGSCDSIYTINLTINTVDTSVSTTSTMLTANASNASYQWVDCNNGNSPIAGDTSASFSPTVNGNYAVQITQNGCTAMSSCYNFVLSSLNQLAFDNSLVAYPNPTTGHFNIDLGASYNQVAVNITDINGRMVYNKVYNQQQLVELDLEGPSGVYFVSITSETKQAVIKLIKQ